MVILKLSTQNEDHGKDGWIVCQKTVRRYISRYQRLIDLLKTRNFKEAGFKTTKLELLERAHSSTST